MMTHPKNEMLSSNWQKHLQIHKNIGKNDFASSYQETLSKIVDSKYRRWTSIKEDI